jgi:hypothetical protein
MGGPFGKHDSDLHRHRARGRRTRDINSANVQSPVSVRHTLLNTMIDQQSPRSGHRSSKETASPRNISSSRQQRETAPQLASLERQLRNAILDGSARERLVKHPCRPMAAIVQRRSDRCCVISKTKTSDGPDVAWSRRFRQSRVHRLRSRRTDPAVGPYNSLSAAMLALIEHHARRGRFGLRFWVECGEHLANGLQRRGERGSRFI